MWFLFFLRTFDFLLAKIRRILPFHHIGRAFICLPFIKLVFCVYVRSSAGYTLLFMVVRLTTYFAARFSTWCLSKSTLGPPQSLTVFCDGKMVTLIYLRVYVFVPSQINSFSIKYSWRMLNSIYTFDLL